MEHYENILNFWFGRVEDTIVPSENRARIWFGESDDIAQEIRDQFQSQMDSALNGSVKDWEVTPRGQLALIIMFDQFSRHIYRSTARAYAQDKQALAVCLEGINQEHDHELSLIERVFYYFPLLHAEHLGYQEQSVRAYQLLAEIAFSETRVIYDSFLKFANHHYTIIQRFGRFPQRNAVLGRASTEQELSYLREAEDATD